MALSEFSHFIRASLRQFFQRRDLQYLFLFAFILRLSYMMLMFGQLDASQILSLSSDSDTYVKAAEALTGLRPGNQPGVWIFGPGYCMFLAIVFLLCGVHPVPVILVQVVLSSLICLMLYRLANELTGSRPVGYIAGILSAVSFTSISLASFLLSDTLFFFLFIWGNLAFVIGIRNRSRSYFVFAGICIGAAALVRSVAQFWPVVLILFIFILPIRSSLNWRWHGRLHFLKKACLAPVIAAIIISGWIVRNYAVHGVPTLALAGPHGLGKLAAATEAKTRRGSHIDVLIERAERYKQELGKSEFNEREQYMLRMNHFREVLADRPRELFSMYIDLVHENAVAVNELYRLQTPRFRDDILRIMESYRESSLHYAVLVLSGLGLAALALRRRWLAFIYTGVFLLYMLGTIGFVMWQGSRPFFPAQMAWTILAGSFITEVAGGIERISSRLINR